MDQSKSVVNTYGVETIIKRIIGNVEGYMPFSYQYNLDVDFKVYDTENLQFVKPVLSEVNDFSMAPLDEAKFILIEAVGASGKTELTKYLSYKLHCPVIDLGKTRVVAGNSLTGLLSKRMQRRDSYCFMDDVNSGHSTLIIDALDEGYMKTNNQGYQDFIDDVIDLGPLSTCPIVMLGRYNAVELTAFHLLERGIPFVTLQIEPFTLNLAKEFIDKFVKTPAATKFDTVYKETRDYIIETIGGFFRDQSSIKTKAAERFFGYAPVLQSIAAFFDENTNFQVVLDELKAKDTRSVSLIIDIIERILRRDREEKVFPNFLNDLIKDRDDEFKNTINQMVYTDVEQCARVLYSVMKKPFPELPIKDPSFMNVYNEHISTWIQEHPFMGKKRICNIVFESYMLARLIHDDAYRSVAFEYLHSNGVSYMFAYIYKELYGFDEMDKHVLPFIYNSFKELNTKVSNYSFDLSYLKDLDEKEILCEFRFTGSNANMEVYSGRVKYQHDDIIDLGRNIAYVNIDVPLSIAFTAPKVDIWAPTYISCSNILISSSEIILCKGASDTNIMFECDDIKVEQRYEQYVQLSGQGKSNGAFVVIVPRKLEYPFYDFCSTESERMAELTADNFEKYKKLRAIILEFRSHSKNELAKHHEKIDFILGNTPIAQKVIAALLDSRIMFKDGHLYKLDSDILDKELGVSYDGIRNFEISSEIIEFLNKVK